MNRAKVMDEDDIQFLMATSKACSATEAARVQPDGLIAWLVRTVKIVRQLKCS